MKKKQLKDIEYFEGSDNIFADLAIPEPEEAKVKAELVMQIDKAISAKKLTQAQAAKVLNISQAEVSLLLRGYFTDFSVEELSHFLNHFLGAVDLGAIDRRVKNPLHKQGFFRLPSHLRERSSSFSIQLKSRVSGWNW
jgi:predicted XRE-type DNA-binding protein